MSEEKEDPLRVGPSSHVEQGNHENAVADDAVFGVITEDGPNYRNLGWIGTAVLMMKSQIGLGVLSIPAAFDTLGMIPGVICLLLIAVVTTWSGYTAGMFKINHREVYGIDDAVSLMLGPVGREILGVGFILFLVFAAASGMLGISIAFNAVSTHGACTAIFVAVGAVGIFSLASIRTLDRVSMIAWAGLVSLIIAVLIVTIAVGVQDRPSSAPEGISAMSQFIFAYAGTPFFFPIISEMRDPREYPKALATCQTVVTVTYVTVGIVVYYYCGSYVASPALGSAGKLIKQISYAIAIPGLYISSMISTHVAGKYIFVRILRGSNHLVANTFVHWGTWIGSIAMIVAVEYCIASGIPIFDSLVSLVGALLATLQCFQPVGGMWLYDNWGKQPRSLLWMLMVFWSVVMVVGGTFLMVGGTYGAVIGIVNQLRSSEGSGAWSCADNSNSV